MLISKNVYLWFVLIVISIDVMKWCRSTTEYSTSSGYVLRLYN